MFRETSRGNFALKSRSHFSQVDFEFFRDKKGYRNETSETLGIFFDKLFRRTIFLGRVVGFASRGGE